VQWVLQGAHRPVCMSCVSSKPPCLQGLFRNATHQATPRASTSVPEQADAQHPLRFARKRAFCYSCNATNCSLVFLNSAASLLISCDGACCERDKALVAYHCLAPACNGTIPTPRSQCVHCAACWKPSAPIAGVLHWSCHQTLLSLSGEFMTMPARGAAQRLSGCQLLDRECLLPG
jgi:hypothetical protein